MRIQFKNIKNVSIDEIFDYLKDLIIKNNLKIDNMNLYVNFLKEGTPVAYSNEKGEEYDLLINGIIGQISPYTKRDTSIDFIDKQEVKRLKILEKERLEKIEIELAIKMKNKLIEQEKIQNTKYLYLCKKDNEFRVFNTVYIPFSDKFNKLILHKIEQEYKVIYIIQTKNFKEITQLFKNKFKLKDLNKRTTPPTYEWDNSIIELMKNNASEIFDINKL
ncbi:MAG: hypothetical protein ACRC30_08240 [Clostridium sp.]